MVKIAGIPSDINSYMGYGTWAQRTHYETYIVDGTLVINAQAGGWVWLSNTSQISQLFRNKYGFASSWGIDRYNLGISVVNGDGTAQGEGCPVGTKWVNADLYVKFSADTNTGAFRLNYSYILNRVDYFYSHWVRTS